ncbi:MAG: UDP-4-amino-4,6-dideoxy-N-acetyl-beta-L-altrosamine transaminase [Ignavibacteriae bacterium]|nr:UDP-4-amino-4,6-dideoxy-N-acetyl-beta-L-altrosamine transaminase [Ignavibacteriota bacterium]
MRSKIKSYSYGRQNIGKDDIKSVIEVLKSDWLTQGPKIQEFENALANKFGAKYCSAVSSGTAALHLTALALGWKKGDIVITSPVTFLASANCAVYAGATPDFADIDESGYTIDTGKLEDKLKKYKQRNKNVKAVVAVDYAGNPSNWEELKYLSRKYGFSLVDDFCHAAGAEYRKDYRYAVKYADAVCMSFHPVKHVTTGEGGAVLTNSRKTDALVKVLRTHGIIKNNTVFKIRNSKYKSDPWYYEMQMPGYNYRITDFQCALGISQLKKLDKFIEERRKIASLYDEFFKNDERFILPFVNPDRKHAYHLYPLQIKFDKLKISKKEFFDKLASKGVFCQVHYIPVHLQPYYAKNFGFRKGDFPVAEKFYEREVSIPVYPSLNKKDISHISDIIKKSL